jgi:hypothetical protein
MKSKSVIFLKTLVRRMVSMFGGVVINRVNHVNILATRDQAVLELAAINGLKLTPGIDGVIFSKDRALQLYSLLISYFDLVSHPAPLKVIYTSSSRDHEVSYKEVEKEFSEMGRDISFIHESSSFKSTLLKVLDSVTSRNIFFLVDDIIFIRPVDLAFAKAVDPHSHVLSFRHSPNLKSSYTQNKNQLPPSFDDFKDLAGLLEFSWFEQGCEWSDPWSVDGQVLSTAEVRAITKASDFSAPNSFETALKLFNTLCFSRSGLCYKESKILNLPINRVQAEYKNISGSISPDYLLSQWSAGMMLDLGKFNGYTPTATHEEHTVSFKPRVKSI